MVPPRAAWEADTYPDAVAACRRLTDPPAGFSRQAWGLKAKLEEAGRLRDPARHEKAAGVMLDQLAWWGQALKEARSIRPYPA